MAYRVVLTFLIFTITRQACGFLLPQRSDRPSWPGPISGGHKIKCKKDQEGSEMLPFGPFLIPCMKCICKGGVVGCKKQVCPSMEQCRGIVVKKPGACCRECQEGDHCLYQGKIYENGDTWFGQKCTKCSCDKGRTTCKDQVCETNLQCPTGMKKGLRPGACCESCVEETAMCTSFGDPHYQTFDNRMYNYQGKCKYIFAKDCATNNFSVQVKNEGRHSRTFSWTKSVFLHYKGIEVALLQNLRVKINGEAIGLPYFKRPDLYIKENSYLMTVTTGIGLEVVWDGDSYTEVHVPISYRNKTCGFCGNFNGDPDDDFQTPQGEVKSNPKEFAPSWTVRNNRMSSCEDDSASSSQYPPRCKGENLMHARKQCFILKNTKFARCHGIVNPRPHYQSCINDMCHCPRSQVHSCLCQSLTAYARACQQEGILVKWRSKSVCGIKCKGGAIYDDCGPACRPTCHNKDDVNKSCKKRCVAGCQCPAKKVWHRKKCITPSKCPKSKKRKTFVH